MKSLTESLRRREEGYSISERELFKLEQIIDQKFKMTVNRLHLGFWLKILGREYRNFGPV
jgi:hypothetical protein